MNLALKSPEPRSGILDVGAYGFPNALRMAIGSEEANEAVVAALTEFMGRR